MSEIAAEDKTFFWEKVLMDCEKSSDGLLFLNRNHKYYLQVQGQMTLKGCKWCDFVVS